MSFQSSSPTIQPRHNGSERYAQHGGYFFVGELLDVGEEQYGAEVFGHLLKSGKNILVRDLLGCRGLIGFQRILALPAQP